MLIEIVVHILSRRKITGTKSNLISTLAIFCTFVSECLCGVCVCVCVCALYAIPIVYMCTAMYLIAQVAKDAEVQNR